MRFVAILSLLAVSAFAVPLADTEVVSPAIGNVAVEGSDVADNIGNNNHVNVIPRDLVTVGALIEALANALAKVRKFLHLISYQLKDYIVSGGCLSHGRSRQCQRAGLEHTHRHFE